MKNQKNQKQWPWIGSGIVAILAALVLAILLFLERGEVNELKGENLDLKVEVALKDSLVTQWIDKSEDFLDTISVRDKRHEAEIEKKDSLINTWQNKAWDRYQQVQVKEEILAAKNFAIAELESTLETQQIEYDLLEGRFNFAVTQRDEFQQKYSAVLDTLDAYRWGIEKMETGMEVTKETFMTNLPWFPFDIPENAIKSRTDIVEETLEASLSSGETLEIGKITMIVPSSRGYVRWVKKEDPTKEKKEEVLWFRDTFPPKE
ncbi:MAG: hypothetical protein K9M51_01285 [Candidatus Gracilibacteria bacterium]|nr:hypothetical protein [Candidatus Gracilibacteria bacterium]